MQVYACICMYHTCICMYFNVCYYLFTMSMYFAHICMYHVVWPSAARKPPPLPQNTFWWGGTRRAPLRAPQVMCPHTLFRHRRPTPRPDLAHPRAPHASGAPKPPIRRRSGVPRTRSAHVITSSSPVSADLGSSVAPLARERPLQLLKNPS